MSRVQERQSETETKLKFAQSPENNPILAKDSNNLYKSVIHAIVDHFFDALSADIFPAEEIQPIFGVDTPSKQPNGLSSMCIGHVVFGLWQGLRQSNRPKQKQVEQALLEDSLPALYQETCKEFNIKLGYDGTEKNYLSELNRRGFDKIKWSTQFLKDSGNRVPKFYRGGRYEIYDPPITVAFGDDKLTEYWLSVFDSRLEYSEDASAEANRITEKIGVGDGGGSYFDLHTGNFGFGFKVSKSTLAEYWKRYGVPRAVINTMMIDLPLPFVIDKRKPG